MLGFEGLKVYEKSYKLALEIYEDTKVMPKEELYGLTGQLRRASGSIAANIAEGYGRKVNVAEYHRFLTMAKGSCYEMMVWINFCTDIGYMREEWREDKIAQYDEIARMLYGLMNKT